jgi:DNA-3-methyladenine glycosylase II
VSGSLTLGRIASIQSQFEARRPFRDNITVRFKTLNEKSLAAACRTLAKTDPDLAFVYKKYGTPPLWDRPQGFPTLIYIILEQQVSLASAKACFDKLCFRVGEVTPENLLGLTDAELKTAGFSRQKTSYARHLAEAVLEMRIDLDGLRLLPDAGVKSELEKLKGIGSWTSDIYLLMAMLRPDIMPKGDLALHVSWQKLTGAERRPGSDEFVRMAEKWAPHRSVAARLLWHFYLSDRKKTG